MGKRIYYFRVTANHYWLHDLIALVEQLDVLDIEYSRIRGNSLLATTEGYHDEHEIPEKLQDIADFFRVPIQCTVYDGEEETEVEFQPQSQIEASKIAFWLTGLLKMQQKLSKSDDRARNLESSVRTCQRQLQEAQELNAILARDNKGFLRGQERSES